MKRDLKIVLDSKFLVAIVLIASLSRLFFIFYFLPDTPSQFGPDEGTYARLAEYVKSGLPVQDFPIYGPQLYNSGKSLILPSAGLIKLGMSPLEAVRTVSTIYSLLTILVLSLVYVRLRTQFSSNTEVSTNYFNATTLLFITAYSFFPSNFLWSILGLRESSSQFWLIATSYFIFVSIEDSRRNISIFLGILSLTFAFGARPQTALVYSIIFLLLGLLILIHKHKFQVVGLVFFGLIGGQLFSMTPNVEKVIVDKPQLVRIEVLEEKELLPPIIDELVNSKDDGSSCKFPGDFIREKEKVFKCEFENEYRILTRIPFQGVTKTDISLRTLENKRENNKEGAISAIPEMQCVSNPVSTRILCNTTNALNRFFSFLARPLPIIDDGSATIRLASYENLIWIFLYFLFFYGCYASRYFFKSFNHLVRILGLFGFILLFACASSFYEGNMGTAFRHRSSILWVLVLLTMVLFINRTSQPKINQKF